MMNTHYFSSLGGLKAWAVAAMENNNHNHDHGNVSESFSDGSIEAFDLLDESWFFENLFNRSRRMVRCFSDPCTSSSINQDHVLAKDHSDNQSSASEKKLQEKGSDHCGLIRAPSLPPCIGKEEKVQARKSKLNRQLSLQASKSNCTEKKHEIQEKKSDRQNKLPSGSNNLVRAPSLPTYIGKKKELIQENENEIRMSKLIRQALGNSLDTLPPRHSPNKAITRSCSMQKFRPPKNLEAEPISDTSRVQFQEMRRRCSSQKPLQKSRSDLAFQELQGFKDLGFRFEKEDLSPGVVNMLPGLQENKIEELKQDKVRRPYLSEAWLAQSLAPPIPNSVSKNSAADMKAQLKFWARAVATNVRQEC